MKRTQATILVFLSLLPLAACKSQGPTRIDATGDEKVTSTGLDYGEFVEIAADMANRLVSQKTFLDQSPYQESLPVRMVLSDVDNKTDLRNFPSNQITGRVRSAGLNSGKIRFVSSLGGEGTDVFVQESQEAKDDPRFKKEDIPEEGSLRYPRLSLRTIIDVIKASDGRARQNTYVVHMFVSEIKTGDILWEEFSNPIAKKTEKGHVGY